MSDADRPTTDASRTVTDADRFATDGTDDAAGPGDRAGPADGTHAPERAIELRSIVVTIDHGPDRQTIYPRDCPEIEQLTTWLSADADVFVDLEARR